MSSRAESTTSSPAILRRTRFESAALDLLCFFYEHAMATVSDFNNAYPDRLSPHSIYEVIARLVDDDLLQIAGERRIPAISRRNGRNQYRVTPQGIASLQALRATHRSVLDRLDKLLDA